MDAARTALLFIGALLAAACAFQGVLYLVRYLRGRQVACPNDERTPAVPRLLSGLSAFGAECFAFVIALAASVWRRAPGRASAPATRPPVVLIHGYALSGASFGVMARRLRRDGWTWIWPVNHTPVLGNIERNVEALASAVAEVRRLSGADRVDIVAHSMGGLVARAFIRNGGAGSVRRVITLGTPHSGTVYGNLAGWADPMVRQMQIASSFLDSLSTADPVPEMTRVISIYSLFDAVVVPPRNAYYAGAFNIEIDGVGHNALLLSRRVYDLIRENLGAEDAEKIDVPKDFMRTGAQV